MFVNRSIWIHCFYSNEYVFYILFRFTCLLNIQQNLMYAFLFYYSICSVNLALQMLCRLMSSLSFSLSLSLSLSLPLSLSLSLFPSLSLSLSHSLSLSLCLYVSVLILTSDWVFFEE